MQNLIETELKIHLQTEENLEKFLEYLKTIGTLSEGIKEKQLNHYFVDTLNQNPMQQITRLLEGGMNDRLRNKLKVKNNLVALSIFSSISIRTRYINNKQAILVVKGSNSDASNGQSRAEWELELGSFYANDCKLDKLLLVNDFEYQAKWSRERDSRFLVGYCNQPIKVDIDKNAGYGYLVELELLADNPIVADTNLEILNELVAKSDFEGLDNELLSKMFAFYNSNWKDFYGTQNTFTIQNSK